MITPAEAIIMLIDGPPLDLGLIPKRGPLPGAGASTLPIRKVRGRPDVLYFTPLWSHFPLFLGSASPPRTELSRLGFVLLCFGQANHKTGAPIVTIFSRECPVVRFDDAAGNREPHSGAFYFC